MKNHNKTFITIASFSCLLITLVIFENAYLTNKKTNDIIISTAPDLMQDDSALREIKNKLKKAGIVPREAKHWKQIP